MIVNRRTTASLLVYIGTLSCEPFIVPWMTGQDIVLDNEW